MTALALAATAHAAPILKLAPEGPGNLPWRVAGDTGFTVDAAAIPDSAGGLALDVYLRLPPQTLRALLAGVTPPGHARIRAELKSGYGGKRQSAEQTVDVAPADTSGEFGQVVLLRFAAKPGPQRLHVRVEDLAVRATKLPKLGRTKKVSEVSGEFTVTAPQQGRWLSDPEFVWRENAAGGAAFERQGRALLPDPERLYGLYATALPIAFSALAPQPKPWHWKARVLDANQSPLASAESTGVAAMRIDVTAALDVSRLPAGGYDLELTAWQEGDATPLRRVSRFSIAWAAETWRRNAGELQDLTHLLLGADDEDQFARMQPGEQERWLEDFWRRRDPTPDTAVNEVRDAFLARVKLANERYGRAGLAPGMFSDMGRVFIRYGEPSDVQRQVIPTGDETLRQVIEELSYTENRQIGGVHPQGIGGDQRPYEVWTYDGDIPAPLEADPDAARNVRHKRLVFLFVDDHGLGDFRLRYSNE